MPSSLPTRSQNGTYGVVTTNDYVKKDYIFITVLTAIHLVKPAQPSKLIFLSLILLMKALQL